MWLACWLVDMVSRYDDMQDRVFEIDKNRKNNLVSL